MRPTSAMTTLVTPYTETEALDAHRSPVSTHGAATAVWGSLKELSGNRQSQWQSKNFSASHELLVDNASWCKRGNYVQAKGKTWEIVGIDDSNDSALAILILQEVTP